jgi:glycosyltransferase involved in cell wall biosynthesis
VLITGWVQEEDLPSIFNGASSFVFPTKHEGFGIPVIQSMACGVPVVISDIPVLREISGDAALYFEANSKEALSEAMWQSIVDQNLRRDLRTKGIKQAKNFSWEKCARETLQVIEG